MDKLARQHLNLSEASLAFLQTIEQQMGIVADLSRADILLYGWKTYTEGVVLAHAQPHSLAHVYNKNRAGYVVGVEHRPEVIRAFVSGKPQDEHRSTIAEGAPVVRQALPIYYPPSCPRLARDSNHNGQPEASAKVVAALIIVTNLIEYERHRLRSKVYRRALKHLQKMLLCGQVFGAEGLTPFGEQDGIIYTDAQGIIRYASGVAANLYRRVGYKETLVGRHLTDLETGDDQLRREAIAQNRCLEEEAQEGDRFWVRKAIPLVTYPPAYLSWLKVFNIYNTAKPGGVLLALHDYTDIRRQDQEIRIKNAMIQEVHHRVKNNLQTIAGLLRMQIRRVKTEEAKTVLDETLKRILSVAVIHEFLSSDSSSIINIKEVSHRIVNQFQQGMLSPHQAIRLELTGDPIFLPARQATVCSLIINELLQNAVEHGFEEKTEGLIRVDLEDSGDEVIIRVIDNGDGVPDGFQMDQADSLGMQIVKILAEDDLKGQIQLGRGIDNGEGLSIQISFPKTIFRGEDGWKEHVSL